MNYDTLNELINQKDEWAVGALLHVYRFQTSDEQEARTTSHENGVGFNGYDADPMSSIAQWFLDKGFVTERQIAFVRKTMKKYINQILSTGGCQPAQIKAAPKTDPAKALQTHMTVDWLNDQHKSLAVRFWFPRGDARFSQALDLVKSLPDRSWNGKEKYWRVGASMEAGEKLKAFGFDLSEAVQKWLDSFTGARADEIDGIDVPGLSGVLMPFQRQGIAFIDDRNGRALIGDEMGLGKTIQAIGYLQLHPELRPALVACPASLKKNWYKEIKKWMAKPGRVQILEGRFDADRNCDVWGDIVIVNYDILSNQTEMQVAKDKNTGAVLLDQHGKPKKVRVELRDTGWADYLVKMNFQAVVMDEIHYNKDSKALRTKACKRLAQAHPEGAMIGLSGTPIVNRAIEFYNAISFIRPDLFPSFWKFAHRYTQATNNGFGWEFKGSKNGEELHKILTETIMIRRRKEDVLTQLPPKLKAIVPFDLTNRSEYNAAARNIIEWIRRTQGSAAASKAQNAEVLVEFEKLKQLALDGKMKAVQQWTAEFLDSGEKLVLFATHTKTLDILEKQFKGICVRIDGSTPQNKRQDIVDRFQTDDKIRLFLGNVKAAGVGLTLTAASNVAFVELPWTPGDFEQAADRCHRIGQEFTVNVWVLIAEDTIEEMIAEILSEKQKTLNLVLDGKETEAGSVLIDLIKRMKEEYKEAA